MPVYLREGYNIPKSWVVEDNPAELKVELPSRTDPDRTYLLLVIKETREVFCTCIGFKNRGYCSHSEYLKGITRKGARKAGMQDSQLDAFFTRQTELQENEKVVLECLRRHGPLSNRELADALQWRINRITGRTNSLRKRELVEDAGKVQDPISGISVHRWRATS